MTAAPKALITGITGQVGSYLTELLLEKGYEVHGVVRRSSSFNRSRIEHLRSDPGIYGQRLFLHYADLTDVTSIRRIIHRVKPVELYHLAGQSHVGLSFEIPESTCEEVGMATLHLLEICRDLDYPIRIYHASSSEIFGEPADFPQTEDTPARPRSPYGCAKAFASHLCSVYRSAFGMFVCSGITYNHESPRRGGNFVTRKISLSAARIKAGQHETLSLGNLDARRDWGYAAEYVDAMWRSLQHPAPDDYVIATGEAHAVRDFVRAAFAELAICLEFEGEGVDEVGRDTATGKRLVLVDPAFFRPLEPARLMGCAEKAERVLGWRPRITGTGVAALMAAADWEFVTSGMDPALPEAAALMRGNRRTP